MPFSSQVKTVRALREIIMGDARAALANMGDPKPDFVPGKAPVRLPRCTPEAQGLSSAALEHFYRQMAAIPLCNTHSLMVLRHGHVVAEGDFAPYRSGIWHVTHSLCKTFTGTAVGFAIQEGLFGLDEPVAPYFHEAGLFTSRRHRAITVRHLLTMRSGITFNEISQAVNDSWVKGIFSSPVAFEPGSEFVYNSMNSYLLSALVCRTSGQSLVEYLTPRLFEPLGFGPLGWEKSPEGYEKGGWGMYVMPEDMAKFGQLYLQNGSWTVNGEKRQLLPVDWVPTATMVHTQSDRMLGYGCQCWVDAGEQGYTMNGMFGQYITVFPKLEVVVVMTAGSPKLLANSAAYDTFQGFFTSLGELPARLPEAPGAFAALQRTLGSLRFAIPLPNATKPPAALRGKRPSRAARWNAALRATPGAPSPGLPAFCGKTWRFTKNKGSILPLIPQIMGNNFTTGVKALHLRQGVGKLTLLWEEGGGTHVLPLGLEGYLEATLSFGRENHLVAGRARLLKDEDDTDVLAIDICLLESSSCRQIKLRTKEEDIGLWMDESPSFETAIRAAADQEAATAGTGQQKKGVGDVVISSEYVQYRLEQLCTPHMTGRLVRPLPKADAGDEG